MRSDNAFVFPSAPPWPVARNTAIDRHYLADEVETVRALLAEARVPANQRDAIEQTARRLVEAVRERRGSGHGIDALMSEYDLSSAEGVMLMCLAEALLRIPDTTTADRLIADKLSDADWEAHLDGSDSLFVTASTWGLLLTGRLVRAETLGFDSLSHGLMHLASRLGEPVVRTAMRQAMRVMGHQFVMGRSIGEALKRARSGPGDRYRYSFDMLGEAALTRADVQRYLDAYHAAIAELAAIVNTADDWPARPGVSIKLSALHPRFEYAQADHAVPEVARDLHGLAVAARRAGVGLTVDSEEASRLGLTLAVFESVIRAPELRGWPGLGIAVQTYQKRGRATIDWLAALAAEVGHQIPVRLVKGAYWDAEIKHAQELGLADFPVFTRKSNSDVAYLASTRALFDAYPKLYGQFATHNAHTAASVLHLAGTCEFEFQRLHGMSAELYDEILDSDDLRRPCRMYAPVGSHEDLLPYLVRRLLENGSNTSFVNRLTDPGAPVESIIADPVATTDALGDALRHPGIVLPERLFGDTRPNSRGINFHDPIELAALAADLGEAMCGEWTAAPLVGGQRCDGERIARVDPHDGTRVIGHVCVADAALATEAMEVAARAWPGWGATAVQTRAATLRRAAKLFHEHRAELLALLVREGGRTLPDSHSELREAIDFLNYYASDAQRLCATPASMPGPTGERNELRYAPRGVFLCISPWNFPLAIFTGQIAAALAGGNSVIAKPAGQTGLVAGLAVRLMHEAGIPTDTLQLLPGAGKTIGAVLLADPRLAGVAFTGSTATAQAIQRQLAGRDGPLATLIAETGGVNAMIADSSALPEQVVRDAVQSGFNSAGQRCSALRLLCLQEEIADRVLTMLDGYVAELRVGDPGLLRTDVGPVIDAPAQRALLDYLDRNASRIRCQAPMDDVPTSGCYVPPTVLELASADALHDEIFGPFVHVARFRADDIDALVDTINATGYGLTLGVHSRIDSLVERIASRARVGNVYVNRNQVGAVVGVQPFGGMGLSGTGPKAGGPNYVRRFMVEQTITVNTAAVGGNASLMALDEASSS